MVHAHLVRHVQLLELVSQLVCLTVLINNVVVMVAEAHAALVLLVKHVQEVIALQVAQMNALSQGKGNVLVQVIELVVIMIQILA